MGSTGSPRAAPRSCCSPMSASRSSPGTWIWRCSPAAWGAPASVGRGGAIAGLVIMTKTEVLLILLGGIFVVEALSVVIQVISFQMFRKRVFLMAPIHHHFELQAWSETKIILRFWIVAVACAAIAFTVYRLSIRG